MSDGDTLQRFLFENSNVRGNFIHLRASYQAVRERYDYPQAVSIELGKALAASALLSSTIKFDGSLIMQIQASGPIHMLVAQCTHDKHIRGLARWQEVPAADENNPYGNGHITITIDASNDERYQGITALESGSLSKGIEHYFAQSEQLQTRLWLVADQEQAVGMLIQHLPGEEPDPDVWNRIEMLGATLTSEEMLKLSTREILQRLFHEEDVRLYDPEPVSFRCSCSREKIVDMLRVLGHDETDQILEEQGNIEVGCEFCNQQYTFDSVDVEAIFASVTPAPPSTSKH